MKKFDYFYNRDVEKFSYYMLPKILITHNIYKDLSSDSKILYSCLLERASLSYKNNWIDDKKRVYIIFTVNEVMETLNKSNKTAVNILNELTKIGLIEKKRQGLGKPNIIYVKDFMSIFKDDVDVNIEEQEVNNLHLNSEKITHEEVKNLQTNKPYSNKLNISKPYISFIDNCNSKKHTKENIKNKENTKPFGRYKNVFLSNKDLEELRTELKTTNSVENYIERLSLYIKSTGKNYKNHKDTLLTWHLKDKYKDDSKISSIPNFKDYNKNKGEYL